LRAYVGRDPVTGKARWKWATYRAPRLEPGAGRRAAERAQRELEREVASSRPGEAMTVAGLLDAWLDHVSPRLAPSTVASYRTKARAIVAGPLGHRRLVDLQASEVDAWYGTLLAQGWTPANVRAHHRVLSSALSQAERWDWVERVVTRRVRPPSVPPAVTHTPSPAEVRQMVVEAEAGRNPALGSVVLLATITGMRRGETCGLQWGDVDLPNRVVTVRRSVWQIQSRWGVKLPKSGRVRRVALDDTAVALLVARADTLRRRAEAARVPGPDEEGWVWAPGLDGRPLMPDTLTQAFRRLCERLEQRTGDPWPYRLHDLRHLSATQLIGASFDPVTVAGRLGHADPSITMRVYAHAIEAQDREAAAALGRALSPQPKGAP